MNGERPSGKHEYSPEEIQRQKEHLESSEVAQSYTYTEEEEKLASELISLDNDMRIAQLNADTAEYKVLQKRKDEIDKILAPKDQAWKEHVRDFDEGPWR